MKSTSTNYWRKEVTSSKLIEVLVLVFVPLAFLLIFQVVRVFHLNPYRDYTPAFLKPHSGLKIVRTPYGTIQYSVMYKNFWATSYNYTCEGCSHITATGMRQSYGVVAVDPKVIPLFSKLYIPGYGIAVAGDVGGAIKGRRIDLGFDELDGSFSSGPVDIYIRQNADHIPVTYDQPSLRR